MKKTIMPAPQRAGTEKSFRYAEDLARWVLSELRDNKRALSQVERLLTSGEIPKRRR